MESHWHRTPASPPNSQARARWRPAPQLPRLCVPDKSGGGMARRYRPRQACATHRWPPSGGFQWSLLSKDKLFNRLLFYEFTLRPPLQRRWRKILGLIRSTLRQNRSLKSCTLDSEQRNRRWDSRLLHNVRHLIQLARAALHGPPRLTSELYAPVPSQTGPETRTREEHLRSYFVVILEPFHKTQWSKWVETLKRVRFHLPKSVYLLSSSRSKGQHLKEDKHKWVRLTASPDSGKQKRSECLRSCFSSPTSQSFSPAAGSPSRSGLSCFSGGVIFLQVTRLQKPPQIRDRSVINLRWHPDGTFYAAFHLETAQKELCGKNIPPL